MSDIYTNYNNGKSPEPGLVWSGASWAYPTQGAGALKDGGTLTVWPDNGRAPIESFNPDTGNGFSSVLDSIYQNPQSTASPEIQRSVSRVLAGFGVPQWDNLQSAPFARITPPSDFPNSNNMTNPSIVAFPARLLSNTPLSANTAAPSSINLHTRIADDVIDGVQYLAAVGDHSRTGFNVPVRTAQALKPKNMWNAGWMPGGLNFLEYVMDFNNIYPAAKHDGTVAEMGLRPAGATIGANTDDMIIWFPVGSNVEPYYVAFTTMLPPQSLANRTSQQKAAQDAIDANKLKDAVKAVTDFYQLTTKVAGAQASKAAQELAANAKGKTLRNAEQALAAFEKHKNALNQKYSAADRKAIATAVASMNKQVQANHLKQMSRGLGTTSKLFDAFDVFSAFKTAMDTNEWRPFFVTVGGIYAGNQATALTALAFSGMLATPMGIVGYVFLLTAVNSFMSDTFNTELKKLVGI